jgi:MYXO-CTERM domain-containing protein
MRLSAGAFVVALAACGEGDVGTDRVGSLAQAIIAGRPSGASENATVFLSSSCSGTLVAPNLVLTARHCILAGSGSRPLECLSNGELANPNDPSATDLRTEDPANVSVRYGADETDFVAVRATRFFAPPELNLCKADLALVVLERPLATTYTPLRMEAPALRERFRVTGWGLTGDSQSDLPTARSSRDDLVVTEVGPGLIPSGTFATEGNKVCFGDSGAGAWFGDAVGGIVSRLDGRLCQDPYARHTFTMLGANRAFIEESFAAAGATPWYVGEPAPWLLKDGAACTSNDACLSASCTEGVCTSAAAAAPAPSASPEGKGCGASSSPNGASSAATLAMVLAAGLGAVLRRRRAST